MKEIVGQLPGKQLAKVLLESPEIIVIIGVVTRCGIVVNPYAHLPHLVKLARRTQARGSEPSCERIRSYIEEDGTFLSHRRVACQGENDQQIFGTGLYRQGVDRPRHGPAEKD